MQDKMNLSDRKNFRKNYVEPALAAGLVEYTIPDRPNSPGQKYRLTEKGKAYKRQLLRRTPSG
ncbi:MAG: Fic family protein [Bacteroidota bacterium]